MKHSKYKGVSLRKANTSSNARNWVCRYRGEVSSHHTEREAARQYDLRRIKDGKAPVNILKRVDEKRRTN